VLADAESANYVPVFTYSEWHMKMIEKRQIDKGTEVLVIGKMRSSGGEGQRQTSFLASLLRKFVDV